MKGELEYKDIHNIHGHKCKIVENLDEQKMKVILDEEAKKFNLVGMSVTKSVNKSNETQEINKDIDYLAMGIPIIGNHRPLTEEKIKSGCGVFMEDGESVNSLLRNYQYAKNISSNCRKLYKEKYSKQHYTANMRQLLDTAMDK